MWWDIRLNRYALQANNSILFEVPIWVSNLVEATRYGKLVVAIQRWLVTSTVASHTCIRLFGGSESWANVQVEICAPLLTRLQHPCRNLGRCSSSNYAVCAPDIVSEANGFEALLHSQTSERQDGLASVFRHFVPVLDKLKQFFVYQCLEWTVSVSALQRPCSKAIMGLGASCTLASTYLRIREGFNSFAALSRRLPPS